MELPDIPMNKESVFEGGAADTTTDTVSRTQFIYILKILEEELYVADICVQLLTGMRLVVLLTSLEVPFVIIDALEFCILIAYSVVAPNAPPLAITTFVEVLEGFTQASRVKLPVRLSSVEFGTEI